VLCKRAVTKLFIGTMLLGAGTVASGSARSDTFTFAIGEWPPFISETAPDHGLHAKKVADAFRSAGHAVDFRFLPWRRSLELTKSGSLPATFSWSHVEARTKDYIYPSEPVDRLRDVYFFRKDRFPDGLGALNFEELKNRQLTVVGITDYWYQAPLREAGVAFEAVATEEQAWTMLLYGRADVYIENDIVGRVHSRALLKDRSALIGSSAPFRTVPLYILFSKTHPDGARMAEIWDRHAAALSSEAETGPAVR